MAQLTPEHEHLMGRMMALAPRLALQEGCTPYPDGGFRIVSNTGKLGGQEVHHMHFHVMGGPRPWLRGLARALASAAGPKIRVFGSRFFWRESWVHYLFGIG